MFAENSLSCFVWGVPVALLYGSLSHRIYRICFRTISFDSLSLPNFKPTLYHDYSGILLGVLIIGLCLVSPEFADTVTHTFTRGHNETNISSLDGRVSIWTAALSAFEQSPILGSGYATYPMRIEAGSHFHNMFIELAVTTGILGLIPILILFGLLTAQLVKLFSCHISEDISDHVPSLDALLIGTVLIVSEMTTAGAAYYSWQMIGIVMLAVALYEMPTTSAAPHTESDWLLQAPTLQSLPVCNAKVVVFESDRNSIIL